MVYVLWESNRLKKYAKINILKTIGIVVIIINSFGIPSNIINHINLPYISKYVDNAVGYFIAVIAVIILIKTGYFKNWKSEQFKFFGRNDTLENDKGMQALQHFDNAEYETNADGVAGTKKEEKAMEYQVVEKDNQKYVKLGHTGALIQSERIRAGYLADMVLLDRDIFCIPPEQIGTARVLFTMVGGEIAYANEVLLNELGMVCIHKNEN